MHEDKRTQKITRPGPSGKVDVMGLLAAHTRQGHSRVREVSPTAPEAERFRRASATTSSPARQVYTDALPSYNGSDEDYVHERH